MSNSAGITDQRHNDYVGTDANIGRIPGAEKATTGHSYIEVFPKEDPPVQQQRPDEHLPPPTGRPFAEHAARGGPTERLTTAQSAPQPQPLAPAPGSRTVVDADPWAAPTSAADTLSGATSRDVHAGLGVPAAGMSSAERHHDGRQHRKRGLQGQEQYGTAE